MSGVVVRGDTIVGRCSWGRDHCRELFLGKRPLSGVVVRGETIVGRSPIQRYLKQTIKSTVNSSIKSAFFAGTVQVARDHSVKK